MNPVNPALPFRLLRFGWLAALAASPLAAQRPLTLADAIGLAEQQGYQARAALATRDAARYRDRAFFSGLLPQLSVGGTVPAYNRSIIPVLQPDGTTLFRAQDQTNATMTMTMAQKLPFTGGDFFVSSSLARLKVSGAESVRTWSSTPVTFGFRQPLLRPNTSGWDRREQSVRSELAERQYLEAREDIAIGTTNLFFDLYSARVALDNALKNSAVNDTLYTLNKGRFEVGKIGENDLLQSELALLRSRTTLDGARLEFDRSLAALRLGLSLPADSALDIAVTAEVPVFEPDTARAVAEALRNRASVSDVALQDVQARRRITEAKLSTGIGATVQASYGYNATGSEFDAAYQNLLEARQFSLGVQIPLLLWGSRKESVQAARADRERVENLSRATLEQTALDAHFAALQLAQAGRNLALSAKADTVAGKRFEVVDNLYLAQNEKDAALAQYVQALRGYWLAHYRLRRLTLFDFATGQPIH